VNHLTRDPVPRGGKVRLPQRPEVSPKQATPLPLPNRLRQPPNLPQSALFIRVNLREPLEPGSNLFTIPPSCNTANRYQWNHL